MENRMKFPYKRKIELSYDSSIAGQPAIPLLGIYPEKTKFQKDTSIPVFITALCTMARTWKKQLLIDIFKAITFIATYGESLSAG